MIIKSNVDTVFNENFHLVDENLSALDFSTNDKRTIFMVLSAILNLGNVQFENRTMLTKVAAERARDCLAKGIYEKLFCQIL